MPIIAIIIPIIATFAAAFATIIAIIIGIIATSATAFTTIVGIIITLIATSATAFTLLASSVISAWTIFKFTKVLYRFALFCFKLGQISASALRERYGVSITDLLRFEISLDPGEWRNRLNQGVSVVQERVATVQNQFQLAIVGPQKPTTHLQVDMFEDTANNMVTVQLDFPGIPKQDIEMSIMDNVLSIVTRRQQPPHAEGAEIQYLIQTRVYGEFEEKIKLPAGTKKEDLTADVEDGVLTITFPRVSVREVEKLIVL